MTERIGMEEKGDCLVESIPGAGAVEVATKSEALLGKGIRAVAEKTLSALDAKVGVRIEDFGALDYALAARIEAAIRAGSSEHEPIAVSPERGPSERDRPRRSRLYAPGNRPRLLAGIEVHGADCVLLDLEDSVPASEKASARILVKHLLGAIRFPGEVWVRINPLDVCGEEDVREVLIGRPHGVCLPKAESPADVARLSELLSLREGELGAQDGSTWVMPILETARGVLHAEEIARAGGRVVALAFGAEDYTRDVGGLRSWDSLLFARSMIVVAAAAAGIQASDTVWSDLDDEEGLVEECALARGLGFDGKGAINPRQLSAIHRAFSPSQEEIEKAKRVVEAAEQAEAAGSGAVALDGKMIDRPVLDRARRLIRYARELGAGGGSGA
jgi:citrate lyase subunit beta/citryl-CoA lyase